MITHRHVLPCIGKWVLCSTVSGAYRGRLESFHGNYIVLDIPRAVMMSGDIPDSLSVEQESTQGDLLQAQLAYGYGGWGRTAIPLAAIFGLTLIGASALRW